MQTGRGHLSGSAAAMEQTRNSRYNRSRCWARYRERTTILDRILMPTHKDQPPPNLKYFNPSN
jgi:hypothetical protein